MAEFDTVFFFLRTQALLVLGLHSLYKVGGEEAGPTDGEASQRLNAPRVLLERFRSIFGERDIIIAVLVVSTLAGIAWAVNVAVVFGQPVAVWAFSLALIEALVLFFAIEVFYLVFSKWIAASLRENRLFIRAVDLAALGGALLVSLSSTVGCMYSDQLSCSILGSLGNFEFAVFFIVFFVSGLGGMTVVDAMSDSVSSHMPDGRKKYLLSLTTLFAAMITLTLLVLEWGPPVFGPGSGFALIGVELATVVGVIFLAYLVLKKRELQHSSSLVYTILMLGLSGLFAAYSLRDLTPPSLDSTSVSASVSPLELALPVVFFGIGYVKLLFEVPRTVERKLGIRHSRLVAAVTFLMLFAVIGEYQRAIFSGLGTGVFFFQKEVPALLGLEVGALILIVNKLKGTVQEGRLRMSSIVPVCTNCGQRVGPASRFCDNCGFSVPHGPERVLFVSHAQQIARSKAHHSIRRKLVSILAGGPMGYLAFGFDFPFRREKEGQLVVTDKAVYFAGNAYLLNRILRARIGHFFNSVVLTIKQQPTPAGQKSLQEIEPASVAEVELKTNNAKALSQQIERAASIHP